MVDIVTGLASVDDDWRHLARVQDVRAGVESAPGTSLHVGTGDEIWVVETVDVSGGLVRFELMGRARTHVPSSPSRAAG